MSKEPTENQTADTRSRGSCCSAWREITPTEPALGAVCWLWDGETVWIGGRENVDSEDWLWGNSYNAVWHNGEKWDGDIEADDDYQPTLWMPLPELPNQ